MSLIRRIKNRRGINRLMRSRAAYNVMLRKKTMRKRQKGWSKNASD